MIDRRKLYYMIDIARTTADLKWGRKSGSEGPWRENPHLGLTILAEEFGEVARAILEHDDKNLFDELVDVVQVCIAWLESMPEELSWGHNNEWR